MIKLTYTNLTQRADLVRSTGANLDTDEGLETVVTISLFTDARATADDGLQEGVDLRGWWGNIYLVATRTLGSRLWLLTRESASQETLNKAVAFAEEALQWLVDERVAKSIKAAATKLNMRNDVILLTVEIQRPSKTAPRWRGVWEVQLAI
jgi:phage gp46-like protein